jgi:hypothetical protein
MPSVILAGTTTGTALSLTSDTSGELQIRTNNGATTAMTLTTGGNINIPTLGARITGDFSNATGNSRVIFQTSTTNGSTSISAIPNGAGTTSAFRVIENSDTTNAAFGDLLIVQGSDVRLRSLAAGTGTNLPLTMYTGGSERLRIDTSGNVGIGTSSPTKRLTVVNLTDTTTVGNNSVMTVQGGAGGTVNSVAEIGFAFQTFSGTNPLCALGYQLTSNAGSGSGALTFSTRSVTTDTAPSERMRIDSSGNVGIGTASPGTKLDVVGNMVLSGQSTADQFFRVGANRSGNGYSFIDLQGDATYSNGLRLIRLNTGANAGSSIESRGTGAFQIVTQEAAPIAFFTNATERARIDSSGNFLVGATATLADHKVLIRQAGALPCLALQNTGSSFQNMISFYSTAGVIKGSVSSPNDSSVAYNTTSDYRLKENVAPMTGALSKVAQLKPCTYTWKSDGSSGQGFIAHELAEVVPDAVTGEKDAVDEDGSIKPQGIDTSFLVATLTAAIQELKAELDSVKAELQTLKGA